MESNPDKGKLNMIGTASFDNTRFRFDDDLRWRPVNGDPHKVAPALNRLTAEARKGYGTSENDLGRLLFREVVNLRLGENVEMPSHKDDRIARVKRN